MFFIQYTTKIITATDAWIYIYILAEVT